MSVCNLLTPNKLDLICRSMNAITINAENTNLPLSTSISKFIVNQNSEENVYSTIQSAIDVAVLENSPQSIIVSAGTYNENVTLPPNIILTSVDEFHLSDKYAVTIIGDINVTGDSGINNIYVNGKVSVTGSSTFTTNFNNCGFTNSTDVCVNINNVNAFVFMKNCQFFDAVTSYVVVDNAFNCVMYACFIGANSPIPVKNVVNNNGILAIFNSVVSGIVKTTSPSAFGIMNGNFGSLGDSEAYQINGGSTIIANNCFILSDNTSSTDLVTTIDSGTILKNNISVIGRNTASAGITTVPIPLF